MFKRYTGKVKDVYGIGNDLLLMDYSNRLSAFDKYVCMIDGKGENLCNTAAWWFNNTKHIIPNNYVHHTGNKMIVSEATPFKIEVIVRGYITGSLWKLYEQGHRCLYGITLDNNLLEGDRFKSPIITCTTKSNIKDEPITYNEIIKHGYVTKEHLDNIYKYAYELFEYGTYISEKMGYTIVDTKYEFGIDKRTNKLVLIDEIHTCDTSSYWFKKGDKHVRMDKDIIREFIKDNGKNVEIPDNLKAKTIDIYNRFYNKLNGIYDMEYSSVDMTKDEYVELYYKSIHKESVIVLYGSESDCEYVSKIENELVNSKLYNESYCLSAHKNTMELLEFLDRYNESGRNIVYITVAGLSNALSGIVAGNSTYPVIACPPNSKCVDSSLMMPLNVPVMTVLSPLNAVLAANRILRMNN